MLRSISAIAATTSKTTAVIAACVLTLSSQAVSADERGIANYASYLDKNYAEEAAATIQAKLSSDVQITRVKVDGNTWLRLQSGDVDSIEAKSLVVRATAAGFPAWYQSTSSARALVTTKTPVSQRSDDATSGIRTADPKLVAMLPEGPLLGELYPPRSPISSSPEESAR